MKIGLVIIFCCVILCASGHEQSSHEELSEENKDTLNAILDIMACIDEGKCGPVDENAKAVDEKPNEKVEVQNSGEENIPAEHVKVPETEANRHEAPLAISPFLTICQKFSSKLEKLESLHPELKSLKSQLLANLDSYTSSFTTECKEGESLVIKILDLVILVAGKLKEDFAGQKHPKQIPVEEIIAEEAEDKIGFVGSIRSIPGVHYPNYTEIPITSFSCSDKYIPGFYADLETGCQVFHVCYEHRRESFLCPLGTIFNQPLLTCDYWYSANCSQAPIYYDVNEINLTVEETDTEEIIQTIVEEQQETSEKDLKNLVKFLPVKAKIVEFPKQSETKAVVSSIDGVEEVAANIFGGIVSTSTVVTSKARQAVRLFPRPKPVLVFPKVMKPLPLIKPKLAVKTAAAIPLIKAKVVSAVAVPIVKAKVVKAKVAAAAIPLIKAKVVSAAAVPIVKAKVVKAKVAAAAIPVVKAKFVTAAAVPVAKAKIAKAAVVPFFKAKAFSAAASKPIAKAKIAAAAVPFFKVKKMAKLMPIAAVAAAKPKLIVPLVKAKLVKSAVISPLTKKALALGYLKLLKAKKLALMG